jgi:hypothetical protein
VRNNGVETSHGNRNALQKKKIFAFFTAGLNDAMAKGIEKIDGRATAINFNLFLCKIIIFGNVDFAYEHGVT